jgi:ABC-2 type transport system ATP-binding protein
MTADGAIAVAEINAIERPEEIATRLVHAGNAPTMLVAEREDLEDYFLRLIGLNGDNAS